MLGFAHERPELTVKPLSPNTWANFEIVMGKNGGARGCSRVSFSSASTHRDFADPLPSERTSTPKDIATTTSTSAKGQRRPGPGQVSVVSACVSVAGFVSGLRAGALGSRVGVLASRTCGLLC